MKQSLLISVAMLATVSTAWAATLRSVQNDLDTIADGSTNVVVAIDSVDTNKAFLVFGVNGSATAPPDIQIGGRMVDGSTLSFDRLGTTGAVDIEWYVVEFADGVSVQRGSWGFTGSVDIITINSVALSNAFPIISYWNSGGTFSADDYVRASLPSSTNLVLSHLDPSPVPPDNVEWQVVEYTDSAVSSGNVTLPATGLSTNITLSPGFDPAKAWLIYSYDTDDPLSTPTIGENLVRGTLSSTNTVVFDRDAQATNVINITWFLVEFNDDTIVQHDSAPFGVSDLVTNVTISTVKTRRTIAAAGYHMRGGKSPYYVSGQDDPGVGWFNLDLTSSTNLKVTRGTNGVSGGATADVGWFVLEFNSLITSGVVYEDLNGDANLADAVGRSNVTVRLYEDDNDDIPDAGDTLIETVTTDATGYYSFVVSPSNTYWVTADSLTVSPSSGYNGGFSITNVWAEQTYGSVGAASFDGTNYTFTATNGAFYGGKQRDVSDAPAALTNAEHLIRVELTTNDVVDVDFGFSFNAIVTTNDLIDGSNNSLSQGSLRKFIENANAISGVNTSEFAIAGTGVRTITPLAFLGFIEDPVVLDATTQDGWVDDPIIQLDGSLATGATAGLDLRTSDSTIRGFIVHSFDDEGLEIDAFADPADRNILQNNWVGIDASGAAKPNADHGILITDGAKDNLVGGTGTNDMNIISGNTSSGVHIRHSNTVSNVVIGNWIGVGIDGTSPVSNGTHGVHILSLTSSNRVGGTTAEETNIIAYNGGDGIRLNADAGVSNAILRNHIFENAGLGIDLNADGVTTNDTGDADTGPNNLQNYPVLTSALATATNSVTISGSLNSTTSTTFRVEFFASTIADPSGNGEGERFLGFTNLTTDAGGNITFTQAVSSTAIAGDFITATATDPDGNTSEFSSNDVSVLAAHIGDFVWDDKNSNGIQDTGEPGLSNVTVRLFDATTNVVAQTVTDGSGIYAFEDQAFGDYFLEFVLPLYFDFSPADQGGDDTVDSDADPATGRTALFSLPSTNSTTRYDAGMSIPLGLDIAKTSDTGGACVEPGDTITYTVTIMNTGVVSHADITVTDALPAGTTFVADSTLVVAPGIVTNTFSDQFNSVAYTNNDGNLPWRTPWSEEGDDGNPDDPLDGTVQIVTDGLATNVLQIADKGRGVWREADLTGYTNAVLRYDYRRASLQPNESIRIYASTNGVFSWDLVEELVGGTNDVVYQSSSIDITSYISTNSAIRILSKGNLDFDDIVYFDNIRIEQTEFSLTAERAGGVPPLLAQGYTLSTGNTLTVTYEVMVDQPSTVTQVVNSASLTSDGQGPLTATLTNCVDVVTVGDRVWFDTTTNSVQDVGELGINDVTVRLYDSATNLLETVLTDFDGSYSFSGWNPGDYFVEFVTPLGFVFAGQDIGGDDTADSDADPVTGRTPVFSLAAGAVDSTWDAGLFILPSGVGDFVWLDANTNGVQDVGEAGISNVTVRIYDDATNLVATTVSEPNGRYTLDSLPPGNYFVEFVAPTNYVFVAQDQGADDSLDSDADPVTGRTAIFSLGVNTNDFTWDAGLYVPPSSIGDFVWYDSNTNGVQDLGEPGWTNLTVRLYDGATNLLTSTATDTNGTYQFNALAPGSYMVEFVAPPNYGFTAPDQGADDGLDSDADVVTGRTPLFTIPSGVDIVTWDAGLIVPPGGLVISKDSGLGGDCVQPGQRLTYTLLVTNTGNVTHTGIDLFDPVPTGTTYVADSTTVVAPVISTGTVMDVFSTQTYTNNDGNLDWTGAWQEAGDDGLPASGDVRVEPAGYLHMEKKDNELYRLADLSAGYTNATLSMDFYRLNLDDTNDYVAVYVSSNAPGNWVELDRFEGPLFDEGGFVATNYNISAYLSTNTAVRFLSSTLMGNGDVVRFDNVRIEAVGYAVTNAGSAPPALTTGHTLAPGEALTVTFQVDVDTGLSFTQVVVNAATLSYDLQPPQQASVTDCVTIVSLGDFVWLDSNTNGIQEVSEEGISGVTVRLYDNGTNLLASTTTDSFGAYDFRDLTAGSYFLEFVEPAGYFLVPQDQGGDDTLDSDPNPADGRTPLFALAVGETNPTYDAGMGLVPVDLSLTKSVDNPTPEERDPVTYTVTVTNSGPVLATGITVTDLLPIGIQFDGAAVSQGAYDSTTGVWTVGSLASSGFATLTLNGTVIAEANVMNIAEVTATDQPDIDSIPNNRTLGEDDIAIVELTVIKCFEDGAYIIDMGQSPQTVDNGLKPYGLLYDLVINNKVTVYWSIDPDKSKDGVDFTVDGKDYTGGPFILPAEFVTTNILSVISTWTNKGVVVDGPVSTNFCAAIKDVTYFPNAVLDLDNGSIVNDYYLNAEIPASSYSLGTPDDLGSCDDIFTLPHADPTWAVHSNLLTFVQNGGFLWSACHAVSVLENLDDPGDADTDPDMNFLSVSGLVNYQTPGHEDGTPPYSYNPDTDSDNIMQFLGPLDGATVNGSEQIYLPLSDGWRPSTTVAVWDPDHADIPALSPGEAAVVAYGRAFGNLDYGMVMYESGHSHDKNQDAEDVAAQRAYFNFLLLAGIRSRTDISMDALTTTLESGQATEFSSSVTGGSPPYDYEWSSQPSGIFSPADGPVTTFTAPTVNETTDIIVKLTVTDSCGRRNFLNKLVTLTPATGITVEKAGNSFANAGMEINYEIGLDYTNTLVLLENARVIDVIPSNTTYVTNSANAGGSYDAGTNAVTWYLGTNMPAVAGAWFGSNAVTTLNPVQDTYIDEDSPTSNKGTETELKSKTDADKVKRPLLQFDLSGIPAGATITNALLRLNVTTDKDHTLTVHRLTQAWTETGATWNNYNATGTWASAGADFSATSFGSLVPSQTGYTNAIVTDLAQGWQDGTWSNYGLVLDPTGPNGEAKFGSREDAGKEPELVLAYYEGATETHLDAIPILISDSGTVTVTMSAEVFGNDAGIDVTAPANLTVTTTGGVTYALDSGPVPAGPTSLPAGGGTATFTYVYTVTAGSDPGWVRFEGAPTSSDPDITFVNALANDNLVVPLLSYQVQVDTNLNPAVTQIVNIATFLDDDKFAAPNTVDSLPAVTLIVTLESYESDYSTVDNLYYRDPSGTGQGSNAIYIAGTQYDPNTAYDVAYYDAQGDLVYTDVSATSDGTGELNSSNPNTNDVVRYGTWAAVVVPDGSNVAATLTAQLADPNSLAHDEFDVVTWSDAAFTDAGGDPASQYAMDDGTNTAYFTVADLDQNADSVVIETISVTVTNLVTGDSETFTLYETGPDTGIFANNSGGSRFGLPLSTTVGTSQNDGTLHVNPAGDTLRLLYADSDDANDTASADAVTVLFTVDLGTTKLVNNTAPNENDSIVYTLISTNSGPGEATGLVVSDSLPAGVTFVSSDSGDYNNTNGLWTIGTLASGASTSLTITVTVDSGTSGTQITNSAAVSALDQADSNAANDSDEAVIDVLTIDLAVFKSAIPSPTVAGDSLQYTIVVTNNGPGRATGVIVNDFLPAEVDITGFGVSQGSFDTNTAVWTVGTVSNAAGATLTITVDIDPGAE